MAHRPNRIRQSRRAARLEFAALEIVGALLTPDIVARVAAFDANDQSEKGYEIPAGLKLRDEIARYYRIGEALWSRFEATRGARARWRRSGSSSISCASALGSVQSSLRRSCGSVNVIFRSATWLWLDAYQSSLHQRQPTARAGPAWMKAFLNLGIALAGDLRRCYCKSI